MVKDQSVARMILDAVMISNYLKLLNTIQIQFKKKKANFTVHEQANLTVHEQANRISI